MFHPHVIACVDRGKKVYTECIQCGISTAGRFVKKKYTSNVITKSKLVPVQICSANPNYVNKANFL